MGCIRLIHLGKAGQGSAAGAGDGGASSAKGGETTCSGETSPQSLRVQIPQPVKVSPDISIPVTDSQHWFSGPFLLSLPNKGENQN